MSTATLAGLLLMPGRRRSTRRSPRQPPESTTPTSRAGPPTKSSSAIAGGTALVGGFERAGWRLTQTLTPITYIAWSLWLTATGVALLA
jgi:hypothetical protein